MTYAYLNGNAQPNERIAMKKGQAIAGAAVGILVLDLWYSLVPGNVANASTFKYPVLYKVLKGPRSIISCCDAFLSHGQPKCGCFQSRRGSVGNPVLKFVDRGRRRLWAFVRFLPKSCGRRDQCLGWSGWKAPCHPGLRHGHGSHKSCVVHEKSGRKEPGHHRSDDQFVHTGMCAYCSERGYYVHSRRCGV